VHRGRAPLATVAGGCCHSRWPPRWTWRCRGGPARRPRPRRHPPQRPPGLGGLARRRRLRPGRRRRARRLPPPTGLVGLVGCLRLPQTAVASTAAARPALLDGRPGSARRARRGIEGAADAIDSSASTSCTINAILCPA
jgi:hypothetical protein